MWNFRLKVSVEGKHNVVLKHNHPQLAVCDRRDANSVELVHLYVLKQAENLRM